jgi:hypothetical protein
MIVLMFGYIFGMPDSSFCCAVLFPGGLTAQAILAQAPTNLDCLLRLSCLAHRRGASGEARQWAQRALEASPKHGDALALLTQLAMERRDWPQVRGCDCCCVIVRQGVRSGGGGGGGGGRVLHMVARSACRLGMGVFAHHCQSVDIPLDA